ncbi:MAG: stage II sporulation protein P [Clostridia bacterium]|nr:stage II sporulation protein P [Clostridia bacterium]
MRRHTNAKGGAAELVAAAVSVLLTFCLIIPNSARILSALQKLEDVQTDDAIFLRLAATEAAMPTETPKNASETAPLEEEQTTGAPAPHTAAGVYETPADILQLERAYLERFRDTESSGTVTETFYGNKSATDVIGSVAVRNCTSEQKPDFAALLEAGAPLEQADVSLPTVLIFHTHTTESYLPAFNGVFYKDFSTHSTDQKQNIVRVGDALVSALEAQGIGVIHDTEVYDASYNGAYARSRTAVQAYLEQYPSIQVTIDVHRDAVYNSSVSAVKPTAEINGQKAAQIMIITGAEEGLVSSFPSWRENLRFALALQKAAQEKYEGLMKPIYFCQRKYNMDLTPCSLLLEFGSDTNTLAEAVYAGYLLGDALGALIVSDLTE